ncbi:MAG TPA: hypothetical protein VM120_12030 [Bryobacteraceae bacterium]|nr:hypothetical protein [Bryobacteraceae bacterium]
MNDLRYPGGKFVRPAAVTPQMREQFLAELEQAPANIAAAVSGWSDMQSFAQLFAV